MDKDDRLAVAAEYSSSFDFDGIIKSLSTVHSSQLCAIGRVCSRREHEPEHLYPFRIVPSFVGISTTTPWIILWLGPGDCWEWIRRRQIHDFWLLLTDIRSCLFSTTRNPTTTTYVCKLKTQRVQVSWFHQKVEIINRSCRTQRERRLPLSHRTAAGRVFHEMEACNMYFSGCCVVGCWLLLWLDIVKACGLRRNHLFHLGFKVTFLWFCSCNKTTARKWLQYQQL